MMSIEDYAQDVGKTVEEIYSLCDKLGIAYKDSNTMLDDTAIILLDNKLQEENEEYVVVTINNKKTKTNITGLTSRDIVRHVLFDIGE